MFLKHHAASISFFCYVKSNIDSQSKFLNIWCIFNPNEIQRLYIPQSYFYLSILYTLQIVVNVPHKYYIMLSYHFNSCLVLLLVDF